MAASDADTTGPSPVTFWRVVLDALLGRKERYDADRDEDVRYLRAETIKANGEAKRLRSWESLFQRKEGRHDD